MIVSNVRSMMTTTLRARTASNACTLASHDSQRWAVPVKSRKSSVNPIKNTLARMILIFLSI